MQTITLTGSSLTLDAVLAGLTSRDARGARSRRPRRDVASPCRRGSRDRGRDARVRRHDWSRESQAFPVEASASGHDRLLVRQHLIAQGPPVPRRCRPGDGTPARQRARVGRPRWHGRSWREHLVAALNDDRLPTIRAHGSVGQSDLAADGRSRRGNPRRVRAGAVGRRSPCSTRMRSRRAFGSLAFADAATLLDALDLAGALDLEALGANRDALDPLIGDVRPYPGLQATLGRVRGLLDGSEVEARALQDPLSFRTPSSSTGRPVTPSASRRSDRRSSSTPRQSNPLVLVDEDRVDLGRQLRDPTARRPHSTAPGSPWPRADSSAAERAVKLLQRPLTGLTEGLGARAGVGRERVSASSGSRSSPSRRRRACSPIPFRSSVSTPPRPKGSRTG